MTASPEPKDLVAAVYRAMASNDADSFAELIHPEIEIVQPGWLPYGGVHQGLAELGTMFLDVLKVIDVSNLEVLSLTADGDTVWATFIAHARDDGTPLVLAEEWRIEAGRCRHLRVWHFDHRPVLRQVGGG